MYRTFGILCHEITNEKIVRILYPKCVANHEKTFEISIQALEHNKKSRLIKIDIIDTLDTLI